MKHEQKLRILWLVAVLTVAVAAAITLSEFRIRGTTRARFARKQTERGRLQVLESELKAGQEAIGRLNVWRGQTAPPLRNFLDEAGAVLNATEGAETRIALSDGWTALRKVLTVPDAPVADILQFVVRAEAAGPPWRLVKLVLTSADTAGRSQAELTFETLISAAP